MAHLTEKQQQLVDYISLDILAARSWGRGIGKYIKTTHGVTHRIYDDLAALGLANARIMGCDIYPESYPWGSFPG